MCQLIGSHPSLIDAQIVEYCQHDLKRCVNHIGNKLTQCGSLNLQPQIQAIFAQMDWIQSRTLEDEEFKIIAFSNKFEDPHITAGVSLRSLFQLSLLKHESL